MTATVDPPMGPTLARDVAPDPVAAEVRVLDAGAVLDEVVAPAGG